MSQAEHWDAMEEKEINQTNYVNNNYTGNIDKVNDSYNFPAEKIIDIEVKEE